MMWTETLPSREEASTPLAAAPSGKTSRPRSGRALYDTRRQRPVSFFRIDPLERDDRFDGPAVGRGGEAIADAEIQPQLALEVEPGEDRKRPLGARQRIGELAEVRVVLDAERRPVAHIACHLERGGT